MVTRRKVVQDLDRDPFSTGEYLRALRVVWPGRPDPDADLRMLRVQVEYGGGITATEMCGVLGHADVIETNGRYGRLGRAMADALGVRSRTGGQWYRTISRDGGSRGEAAGGGHFVWEMRPEFEEALRRFDATKDIFSRPSAKRLLLVPEEAPAPEVVDAIEADFRIAVREGEVSRRLRTLRRRAACVAEAFVRAREARGRLSCDECGFDARRKAAAIDVSARSLLDVHHMAPLAEGSRITTVSDFRLLCPTCHRIEHARLRAGHLEAG